MKIVQASVKDKKTLDEIAVESKFKWGYPKEYLKFWEDLLYVQLELLECGRVYKAIDTDFEIMGFFGIEGVSPELTLQGFWVRPSHMGKGVGKRLYSYMIKIAKSLNGKVLTWESDPNALGFYSKMGAQKKGERIYKLDGKDRCIPIFEVEL